jgi:hypothetical protein
LQPPSVKFYIKPILPTQSNKTTVDLQTNLEDTFVQMNGIAEAHLFGELAVEYGSFSRGVCNIER